MEKKSARKAVVIGVNNYHDPQIPGLSGAVADASEIRQKLKDFGDFEIHDDHFLTNQYATCTSIRKAISDLLWKDDELDMALFYFSGHGFQDGYGNGYLAPHDMRKGEPLVAGINMEELRKIVLKSVNKKCVVVILDCCYSGILTKGDKDISKAAVSLDPYFSNLDQEERGEGKIIITSSGGDQKSRELEIKSQNGASIFHGVFTYHIIEGLDGKAADETGTITLDKLFNYAADQFLKKEQKPKYYAADSGQMNRIKIARSSQKYQEFITRGLLKALGLINSDYLQSIITAAEEVQKVLDIDKTNAKAIGLRDKIEDTFSCYRRDVDNWMRDNELELKSKILNVFRELDNKLIRNLYFEKVSKLDKRGKTLLANLCEVSTGKLETERFIEKCQPYNNEAGPSSNGPKEQ